MRSKHFFLVLSLILLAAVSFAAPGAMRKVGKPGEWADTRAMIGLNGKLYSVEKSGTFYVTDPKTGTWKKIADLSFPTLRSAHEEIRVWNICALGDRIYMIINGGSLYGVNPADGNATLVGKAGDWENAVRITGLNGKLYSVERGGALWVADPATGERKKISDYIFIETTAMVVANGKLFIIWMDKDLTLVNPEDAKWSKLNNEDDWHRIESALVTGGKIYVVSTESNLFEVNPDTGAQKQLAKLVPDENITDLHWWSVVGDKLYAVDRQGNLVEISLK